MGRHITAGAAKASDLSETGSVGGVATSAKAHLVSTCEAKDRQQGRWWLSPHVDITCRTIPLKAGRELLLLAACARDGVMNGIMKYVSEVSQEGKRPFILMADFNRVPGQLGERDWLARVGASPKVAQGGEATRHQGKGSCIDYVICSGSIWGR